MGCARSGTFGMGCRRLCEAYGCLGWEGLLSLMVLLGVRLVVAC